VVDGGPPQVAAAAAAMAELGIDDVALCGLAKRLEEVWLPGDDYPVILERSSEGLYLLQRLRDEAHRFAITAHRKRRSKGMTTSALDAVPGLGPARQAALLKRFGSVKRLRAASVEEIAAVPGMGARTAAAVVAALAGAEAGRPVGAGDAGGLASPSDTAGAGAADVAGDAGGLASTPGTAEVGAADGGRESGRATDDAVPTSDDAAGMLAP
jgi:excinuclease ABC subunit C